MTLTLLALWIAGHSFNWYWLIATVIFDGLWLTIKMNFMAVMVRRSTEQVLDDVAAQVTNNFDAAKPTTKS